MGCLYEQLHGGRKRSRAVELPSETRQVVLGLANINALEQELLIITVILFQSIQHFREGCLWCHSGTDTGSRLQVQALAVWAGVSHASIQECCLGTLCGCLGCLERGCSFCWQN